MKDKTLERISYIDVMKGIGILLVCLGHATSALTNPLNIVILSFHMPLFFFVSGILFESGTRKNFGTFLLKKSSVLMLPQLVLAIVTILADIVLLLVEKFVFHREGTAIDFITPFLNWFLIVLFVSEIVLWVIDKIFSHKKLYRFILLPVLIAVFLICNYMGLYVQQILVAAIFLLLGWLAKPVLDKYVERFMYKGIFVFLIPLVVILASMNLPIGMYMNQYGNKVLFLIVALIGIVAIFDLSVLLKESRILQFFGQNSIIIYVTHFALQKFLRLLFSKFGVFVNSENTIGIMALFIATVVIEVLIVLFANKYFYFLFGKKKKQ